MSSSRFTHFDVDLLHPAAGEGLLFGRLPAVICAGLGSCAPVPSQCLTLHPRRNTVLTMDLPSAPHPSENKIHIRIQMYDNESSLTALMTALNALDDLCGALDEKYTEASESWKDS